MTGKLEPLSMTESLQDSPLPIPKAFLEQVKQALENLYDFPFLQNHALVQYLPKSNENNGQRLRRDLIEAIEKLNPGADVFFRSPHARLYNLLQLHYVEAMTIQETAYELGISPRQAYRVLRRGQESVALLLWDAYGLDAPNPIVENASTGDDQLASMQLELARLRVDYQRVDAVQLLHSAQKAVERLASQLDTQFSIQLPSHSVWLATNAAVAQQTFVNLLSYAIKQAHHGKLIVNLTSTSEGEPVLHLDHLPLEPQHQQNAVLGELLRTLEWRLETCPTPNGPRLSLFFAVQEEANTLLIIDDNQGLIDLLERYVSGQGCQVLSTTQSIEGLSMAEQLKPDAIILDVMMPDMDGWEFLQRLRANPSTESIPVIICSVFNDPELAYSLGASAFVAKPVQREPLLHALQTLAIL